MEESQCGDTVILFKKTIGTMAKAAWTDYPVNFALYFHKIQAEKR